MVIGAAKRIRCLMVPYLVVFGLAQIGLLVAIVACVLYLHKVSGQTALSLAIGKSNQVLSEVFAILHKLWGTWFNLKEPEGP